ncbi:hypothetical protein C8R44DRAFT_854647 [Mycena epipterygia]|nr:hypothetical protein C8R44DRAFT_854647 [Mycena epipterygia]
MSAIQGSDSIKNEPRADDILDQMTALVRGELDRLKAELHNVSAERDSLRQQLDEAEQARHDLEQKYVDSLAEAGMKLDEEKKARQALEAKCAASETHVAKVRADENEIRKDREALAADLKKLTKTISDTTKRNAQKLSAAVSQLDDEPFSNPEPPTLKRKRINVPAGSSSISGAPVRRRLLHFSSDDDVVLPPRGMQTAS